MPNELVKFTFAPFNPEKWDSLPNNAHLEQELSRAILAQNSIEGGVLGLFKEPNRVNKLIMTSAAREQILSYWHGHRKKGSNHPPAIPLKYFVSGFGQKDEDTWVDIEMYPGVDSWEVDINYVNTKKE